MGCKLSYDKWSFADVAELVDAPDLGSGFSRSEGSSPFIRIPLPLQALDTLSKLLLLACSQRKRFDSGVLPAIDRYDGPIFRLLRRYFQQNLLPLVDTKILSAKYGLISADHLLPYYDRRLTKEQSATLSNQVIATLAATFSVKSYTNLLVQEHLVAGDYADGMPPTWTTRCTDR